MLCWRSICSARRLGPAGRSHSRFTFVFLSLEEIRIYLEFYFEKGRGGSGWRADGRPHPENEGQSAFSRLPLRLRKEPNRQKVVKALKRALDVFGREM
jgi:hypothetical protein